MFSLLPPICTSYCSKLKLCYFWHRDRVLLLNKTTEVINYWMTEDGPKPTLEQAEQTFPECYFKGS